jgi:hypothetical protein
MYNQNAFFNPGKIDLPVAPAFIQSDLVLYLDSRWHYFNQAVRQPTNAAVMENCNFRRGTCTFAVKVKAAQDAGAIAVIIVNNADGEISMSWSDETITIPGK